MTERQLTKAAFLAVASITMLPSLGQQAPDAWLTHEAKIALSRLSRRYVG
jgi:hypothetical protein